MVPTRVVLHCTATDQCCDDYGKNLSKVMATQVPGQTQSAGLLMFAVLLLLGFDE